MFKNMVESKNGSKIIVKCFDCNKKEETITKEHNRRCKRQSKHFNEFRCKKCMNKHPKFIEFKKESAKHLKSEKFRKECSIRSKKLWDDDEFREKCTNKQSDETKSKISAIIKKKHEDPEYIRKIKEARKKYWQNDEYRKKQQKNFAKLKKFWETNKTGFISKIQKILYSILDDLDIDYIEEYKVGYYHFDCFLPKYNLLIECNGDYWHKTQSHIINDKNKSNYIENYFPEFKIKTFWEKDFLNPNKIIECINLWTNKIAKNINFSFSDLKIERIDNHDAVSFLSIYHYNFSIGHGRSQIRYGCFLDDKLIAVCCFASVTRNETAKRLNIPNDKIRELTRFCIHPLFQKKNLASWFISRCIKMIKNDRPKTEMLITFADHTFNHHGTIYKATGWVFDGLVPRSYWYVSDDGYVVHKKTLYNHARSFGVKEAEYANKNKYTRIWGKEKSRFIMKI